MKQDEHAIVVHIRPHELESTQLWPLGVIDPHNSTALFDGMPLSIHSCY